jgi:hypothetical protein
MCATLGACASVSRETGEDISVLTEPAGAMATIADTSIGTYQTCTTPCAVHVRRNGDISVAVKKDGYQSDGIRLQLQSSAAGAIAVGGNVLLGGIPGIAVDTYNGAAYDHQPNPVRFTLKPMATHR